MTSKSGETSSSRHRQDHQYAAQCDSFPGWMGQGSTAQSTGRPEVPEVIFKPAHRAKPRSRARKTTKKAGES